jgi:hypothetical protein
MNRHIKFKVIASWVLITTLTASGAARAETIFLTCPGLYPTSTITVDLTNNTVNNYAAKIDATSIDWREGPVPANEGMTMTRVRHIDRTAGTVTGYTSFDKEGNVHGSGATSTVACTAGSAPPTKF